ncbi:MAG: TVP38/TMEM64 family protein [Lachnospiraceae bacterium]|nr:TVP38/TMEM64 family protein [Lachnospiraceae bacterium]MDD3796895.1 TVP38/TMEM64 family protein [Lachnospiraceae bacterium]
MESHYKKEKNKSALWLNLATILGILTAVGFIIYGWKLGIFSSREAMEAFLQPFGLWAPVIFTLIQAVQVVIPILPGGVSCLGGVLLFGAGWGFFYNYVGICIGSVIAFLLAKRYGRPLVQSIVSERSYERYSKWLDGGKKFDRCFMAAIFFPVAPDDLLCYLAGLTKMSVKKFTAIILLAKPASIALYSMGLVFVTRTLLPV